MFRAETRSRSGRLNPITVAVSIWLSVVASAQEVTSRPVQPRVAGSVVMRSATAIANLNPLTRRDITQFNVLRNYLHPYLLIEDPDDGTPRPWLSPSRPVASADGKAWTWSLEPTATWADGTPVTTKDILHSWALLQELGARAASTLGELGKIAAIEALDDLHFVVRYAERFRRAEASFGFSFPVAPAATTPSAADEFAVLQQIPTCGPYRIAEWTKDHVVFERRLPWWGDALPRFAGKFRVKTFTLKAISDRLQEIEQLKAGAIDMAALSSLEDFLSLRKNAEFTATHETACYYLPSFSYIGWNCGDPIFSDARVRRAMSHLFRREQISESHYDGLARSVSGPFYCDGPHYDRSIEPPRFSVTRARKLLEEAGWTDTDRDGFLDKDGKKLEFSLLRIAADVGWVRPPLQYFAEDAKQAGVAVRIESVDDKLLMNERLPKHDFQAYILIWRMDPFQPDFFNLLHSTQAAGGLNWQDYKSPTMDGLLDRFRAEEDPAKLVDMAFAIHRLVADDQPITFLLNTPTGVVWSKRLKDVTIHKLGLREWDIAVE